ncbi:MAG: hypothetical protein CK425_12000 [Parachlamydia sp.]|nr:MAG: hypothetical protein CK425_12000 [Parachlamydia sp.]
MRFFYFSIWSLIFFCIFAACARVDPIDSSVMQALMLNTTRTSQEPLFQCKRLSLEEHAAKHNLNPEKLKNLGFTFAEFETNGFNPGNRYTLYMVDMLFTRANLGDLIVNDEGQLVNPKSGQLLYDTSLVSANCMNGEQCFFVLEAEDKKSCLIASFTPDPIEYGWGDGAYMQASVVTADTSIFAVAGKGFQPNEPLKMISENCGENLVHNFEAYPDGCFSMILMPRVVNVEGGSAKFIIQRKQSDEIGILKYLWGTLAKMPKKAP